MTGSHKVQRKDFLLFIVLSLSQKLPSGAANACLGLKNTVQFVKECPMTNEAVQNAAKRKNCDVIAKNCTGRYLYHCVPTIGMDALTEICAVAIHSQGVCVGFDNHGNRLQEMFDENCRNFAQPCPERFSSTHLYKYENCFHLKKKYVPIRTTSPTNEDEERNSTLVMVFSIITMIIGSIMTVGMFYKCWRKWKRKGPGLMLNRRKEEEETELNPRISPTVEKINAGEEKECLEPLTLQEDEDFTNAEAEMLERIDNLSICMSSISNRGFSKESFDELVKQFGLHQLEETLANNGVDCLRTFLALSQKHFEEFGFNVGQQTKCLETIRQIKAKTLRSSSQTLRKDSMDKEKYTTSKITKCRDVAED